MKNLIIFMIVLTVQVSATTKSAFAQERVSLDLKNVSLKECIKEIENQTNLGFLYNGKELNEVKVVNAKFEKATVVEVLDKLLKENGFTYEIENNVILISKSSIQENEVESIIQEATKIKGKITDENGYPLPGATILEAETLNGTTTDVNGNFTLSVSGENPILKISYIGFETQEIIVGTQTNFNIVLKPSASTLGEVVVVGYGTQKKERIGSAISQVTSEEIGAISVGATSFEQILGGQIKGVQITQSSGAPGAAAVIRVRGITSPFSGGNNQPLYIVDGVPFNTDVQFDDGQYSYYGISQNPLLSISPEDIKSFTVLKDAAATAIYGSRGANGVILITTKRGEKNSKLRTTLEYSLSLNNPIKKLDVLNAEGFKELHTMIAKNTLDAYAAGSAKSSGYKTAYQIIDPTTGELRESVYDVSTGKNIPVFGDANMDWQDEVYRKNAPVHKWNINMSGGNEHTNFSLGISHIDQQPLFMNSSFKRYGARLGIDSEVNNWLKIGSSLNYSGSRDHSSAVTTASLLQMRPDYGVYETNGDFKRYPSYWINISPGVGMVYFLGANPVAQLESELISNSTSFIGNAYAEATIFKGFKFRTDVNTFMFNTRGRAFYPLRSRLLYSGVTSILANSISENLNTSLSLQANYHKLINSKHAIDAMVGTSWDKTTYFRNYVNYSDLADDYVLTNAPSANTVGLSGEVKAISGINSVYSRMQYSYDGIYTATINFRTDKSSKFGPGNKRAYFPSLALNWNIDREKFMNKFDFVNKLIFRTSYGKSGSANVADFAYLQFFIAGTKLDEEYIPGSFTLIPDRYHPNADIRWESTKEFNLGLDFSLFSNRLYGSLDIYDKYTDGILIRSPYPLESGATRYTSNLAEVSNKGWEFEIGGDIIRTTDFNWSVSFNIAANHNKVENMEGHALSSYQSSFFTVGEPVGVIKGYRVVKIIQTQEEIDALNAASPTGRYYQKYTAPGDYLYKDLNGDGRITADDKEIIGNIQPDYFGGFNTMFSYKRFSLLASFHYSIGNESQWLDYRALFSPNSSGKNASPEALTDTWTPENTDATYPRLIYGNSYNTQLNDAILQDASYLRLKIIRINYEISQSILNKLSLRSASVYVSATNLFTWTNFKGVDPEAGGTTITGSANNQDNYPYSKTVSFGIKIGL